MLCSKNSFITKACFKSILQLIYRDAIYSSWRRPPTEGTDAMAGQSPTVAEDESHYCCDCVSSKCGADMTQFIFKFVKTVEPFGQEADVMKTGDLEPKTTVKFYIEERDCEEEEMSDEGVIGEPLVVPGIDQEEHFEFVQLQKFSQVWPLTQFFFVSFL